MADWAWILEAPDGDQVELVEAGSRRVTWPVDGAATASFSMSGRSEAAAGLESFASDLLIRLDGELVYRGRVINDVDDVSPNRHTVTVETVDYRGLLGLLARIPAAGRTFTQIDQGQIAWQLINDYQARPGVALGITQGLGNTSGTLRDREYDPGKPVGEAIGDLGRVDGGFEWEIDPLLVLNRWYPQRGRGLVGVLDHGGRLSTVRRSASAGSFANAWTVTGSQETTPVDVVAADVATDPRGRWEQSRGYTSIIEQTTLDDRAAWLLNETSTLRPEWACTMAADKWAGPDDVWVGDLVDLSVHSGRLAFEGRYRVVEVAAAIDQSNNETVTLGVIPE